MINAACFSVKVFPSWKSRWGREAGMYLGDSQKSLPDVGWNMIVLYVPQPLERTSWVSPIRAVLTKIKKIGSPLKMLSTKMLITSTCFQQITSYLVHTNFSLCMFNLQRLQSPGQIVRLLCSLLNVLQINDPLGVHTCKRRACLQRQGGHLEHILERT